VKVLGLYANAHRNKVDKPKEDEHSLLIIEEQFPTFPDSFSSRDLCFLTIVEGVNRHNEADSTTTSEKQTFNLNCPTHLPHHAKPRETSPSLMRDIKIQAYAPLFDFLFHWCYSFARQSDRDIFVMRVLTNF
jgi:hypothetical protein